MRGNEFTGSTPGRPKVNDNDLVAGDLGSIVELGGVKQTYKRLEFVVGFDFLNHRV